ncbi:MAG: DUF192 domain-containing protein [Bacteroidetes Order II. Incertae sedis bacterium]|nr:DUF192 domain-containing protein [Bacteroidetes Order II. bacterium]
MKQLFLFCLCLFIAACNPEKPAPDTLPKADEPIFREEGRLWIMNTDSSRVADFKIEIADSPEEQEMGLMNRTSLPENSGMLFIFPKEEPQQFWMANTLISLDLVFINAEKKVVTVAKLAQPQSTAGIPSAAPAKYVLEIAGGQADHFGITEGMTMNFSRTDAK